MFDRLLALLMTLTLAVPAIVAPPCCCLAANSTCRIAEEAADKPACCQTEAALPPCCRNAQTSVETAPLPTQCGCDGCLSSKPASPLAGPPTVPEAPHPDDLPPAFGAGPLEPPHAGSLDGPRGVIERVSLNRPPPDRQALFCVWVI
ncbi:hypothetical protein Pla108_05910 [Botrimarina colliarenosi]|uniref:Uncharacterized protein n=1 Tax=Botrimarina colliarenosi TaxID=2528001 RepID=A0A5C6AK74_9BACT|nr:hypothetical protein [Botrimarina colliarenosi]TWT99648.1 hypothetical protein Pla108_05910 [Botrimarina colliarenosi]